MRSTHANNKTLFIVNYDWRNLFQEGRDEFFEKLQRDQLSPEINEYFFFSWAKKSYVSLDGEWKSVHKKTYGFEKIRPLFNLWAFFIIPYTAYKYKIRPDAWVVYDFGMVPAMWLAKKLFGGVLIMYVNNQPQIYSETRRFGKVKGVYSWVAERTGKHFPDHFFTLNETMKDYLENIGIPREMTTVYNVNTIHRDKKYIEESKKGVIRKQFNIPQEKKVIVTVARLEAEKNYPLLLKMFSHLNEDHVLFCLGDGSLMPFLKKQAENLGIQERVFFPGFIERKDIWNYYKDADVFVLLSKAEALGIVFWEAMYVDVPTIGSEVDGIMESLGKAGERGLIWKEEDGPEEFVELVTFCTTPSNNRDVMITRAKQFVGEQLKNTLTLNDFLDNFENK